MYRTHGSLTIWHIRQTRHIASVREYYTMTNARSFSVEKVKRKNIESTEAEHRAIVLWGSDAAVEAKYGTLRRSNLHTHQKCTPTFVHRVSYERDLKLG